MFSNTRICVKKKRCLAANLNYLERNCQKTRPGYVTMMLAVWHFLSQIGLIPEKFRVPTVIFDSYFFQR
jgi:hypothetical protein